MKYPTSEITANCTVHAVKPLPSELPDTSALWSFAEMDNDKVQPTIRIFKPRTVAINGSVVSNRICIGRIDSRDDAEIIVRAVNSHARLVAACEAAIVHMLIAAGLNPERTYCYNWIVEPLDPCACQICNIRAALAAAKGQP